ncbi:MAG TPA: hypothetical protein VFD22_10415 [Gemmatimonadaceae bacterium]|nr:hypothetical protein [Gemmatimonadaceae bacterium]
MESATRKRLLIAIVIAIAAGLLNYHKMRLEPGGTAGDYTWYWRAGHALLDGHSPYDVIKPVGPYPFDVGFNYPMTTAIFMVPFAKFSPALGSAIVIGIGTFLLAFGITREGFGRLAVFGSIPFFVILESGQLAPLIAAAALIPAVSWLSSMKPNIGLASVAYNPSFMVMLLNIIVLIVSIVMYPHWPAEWLDMIRHRAPGNYGSPLMIPGGFLLLLSLIRWKRPEARLLAVMAIVPQSLLFTDQLMLWLVPKTRNESMILSILSFPAMVMGAGLVGPNPGVAAYTRSMGPPILALLYLPCLIMVLRRPNEGQIPEWPFLRRGRRSRHRQDDRALAA